MKKKRGQTLAHWVERLPGADRIPFPLDRLSLYRIADLYKGYNPKKPESWTRAFDHQIYEWTLVDPTAPKPTTRPLEPYEVIAERLHDTAIGMAIDRFLKVSTKGSGKPAVGFMGGHDTNRDDPAFRQVAVIACTLRKSGFTIVSGGGPGLMEAVNFGAFMAPYNDAQFDAALATLAAHPQASDHAQWVASACAVRAALLPRWNAREQSGSESLGIPTWYYGNEPPNLFASHTGKYFFNSVRKDGLDSIANGGVVFGPGKAGTVQEIFQDAPLNFYPKGANPTPMILLGSDFWNPAKTPAPAPDDRKPVYPLLLTLSRQAKPPFDRALLLTDDANAVVKFISDFHTRTLAQSATWAERSERFKGRALAAL